MPFEYLVKEIDGSKQESFDWSDYSIGYFMARNKNKTTANEDVLFIKEEAGTILFGVSDGAGGHPRGKDAANICGESVINISKNEMNSKLNMIEHIEKANNEVISLKAGAHATLTIGMICEDTLKCFSVGDSELIYWNRNGTELYSNIPHSEVGYKIEAGLLAQEESLDEDDRYIVNNLIGDPVIRIEATSRMPLKKGHTVLVGSDGVFDNLSHESLKDIVATGSFAESFKKICSICEVQDKTEWKKDDDISFVLIRKVK